MPARRKPKTREPRQSDAITHRDFVNGILLTVAASSTACAAPTLTPAMPAPPQRTSMRGSHPGAFEAADALRDGTIAPQDIRDSNETYDLVVVGGGLSGLSAAHFFRKSAGADKTVLIIENHDDFGDHAKRNEVTVDGQELVLNGGTLELEAPEPRSGPSAA